MAGERNLLFARTGLTLFVFAILVAPSVAPAIAAEQKVDAQAIEFFEKEVRPVLIKRCYQCHSAAAKQEGNLVLDSRPGWQQGGDSGPALKAGDPEASLLVTAIRYGDDALQMPPAGKLPQIEIDVLVKWVKFGAPDPRADDTTRKRGIDLEQGRQHWSFQPIRRPVPPEVKDAAWCRGPIDRFLRARQEQAGLAPVADADKLALVRRATLDLIGLPPTPEEVDAFISGQAFENLVDRLLDSPHFGERWGQHWLDVARFAETSGATNNLMLIDAWRYRDYVIAALNRDKPYDQFLIEQLAGDLLPAASPPERDELTIATGFLALGTYDYDKFDPQARLDQIDEQIEVTSKAMLGLTVACARCHDHKYDPIPTTDYYALAGIFSSTAVLKTAVYTKGNHTLVRVGVGAPITGFAQPPFDEFSKLQEDLYGGRNQVVRMGWEHSKLVAAAKSAAAGSERTALQAQAEQFQQRMDDLVAASERAAAKLRTLPPLPPTALGVCDAAEPRDETVRIRGEVENVGPIVPRGFVSVITTGQPTLNRQQSGRLELARWIASPQNPLTARVAANRVWYHLFGAGLVPSIDNFGLSGETPSHPELLDYLAGRLIDSGWSIKSLIREIMLSRTYQLSVVRNPAAEEIDGENRLLWRMNRRRLEAEVLRDSLLAFSGRLDLTPKRGSLIAEIGVKAMRYERDRVTFDAPHRSIYLPQPREKMCELLALFDAPDRLTTVSQREVTTVPSQALFLLNSPEVLAEARRAAERLLGEEHASEAARIDQAFRLALGRPATNSDQQTARQFFAAYEQALPQAEPVSAVPSAPKPLTKAERKAAQKSKSSPTNIAPAPPHKEPAPATSRELQAWTAFCQLLVASSEFSYVH